jgi:predicted MFS family arabinose efflux permease
MLGRRESVERRGRSPAWRAAFTAVLAAGMAASTFGQFVFGVLAPYLLDEFDISRSQLGLLTTSTFVVGGIASPIAGRLVDRIGGRRVFVGSLALVCAATAGMAVAPSYLWMLFGAAASGAALASCNPTTNRLIADHTVAGERGVIMGVKQAGVQFGALYIGTLVPAAAAAVGWRGALAATAVMPLAGMAAALRLIPADPARRPDAPPLPAASKHMKTTARWMSLYALLMGTGVAVIGAYLPLYAREEAGFSLEKAGALAATIGFIGVLSRVAWGWGTERLPHFSLPLAVMAVGSAAAALLALAAPASGGWILWGVAVMFGTTAVTWNAVGMLAIVAEVESEEAGRASGYVQTGFYAGFVVSPALFGYSVDVTGSYAWGWSGAAVAFAAAAFVAAMWHRARRAA